MFRIKSDYLPKEPFQPANLYDGDTVCRNQIFKYYFDEFRIRTSVIRGNFIFIQDMNLLFNDVFNGSDCNNFEF
jgi:hypothetical protein